MLSLFSSSLGFVSTKSAKTVYFLLLSNSPHLWISHDLLMWWASGETTQSKCLNTTACWDCDSFLYFVRVETEIITFYVMPGARGVNTKCNTTNFQYLIYTFGPSPTYCITKVKIFLMRHPATTNSATPGIYLWAIHNVNEPVSDKETWGRKAV